MFFTTTDGPGPDFPWWEEQVFFEAAATAGAVGGENGIGSFMGAVPAVAVAAALALFPCLKLAAGALLVRPNLLLPKVVGLEGGGAATVGTIPAPVLLLRTVATVPPPAPLAGVTRETVVSLELLMGNSNVLLVLRGVAGVTVIVAMLVIGFLVLIKGLFLSG